MILWSVKKETDIRRGRHCVFLMHVHLVFVTRYRRQIFDHDATEKLRTYFSNVCAYFEAELVEMDGEPDHVHLLIKKQPASGRSFCKPAQGLSVTVAMAVTGHL